jgi:hypothetical protein
VASSCGCGNQLSDSIHFQGNIDGLPEYVKFCDKVGQPNRINL